MKILVVDDEAQIQPLFEQWFRREISRGDVQLTFAHSGEEALSFLDDSGIILILSDINMPGMSGLELLRRIRTIHPQRPPSVMMITAYGNTSNRQQASALGADDFLSKPINFSLLKEKISLLTS